MRTLALMLLVAVFAVVAVAADVTGKWKSEFTTPDGQTRSSVFTFKVEGDKLTGTVGGPRGDTEIQEGKVSGDDISFVVVRKFQDREFKMSYKGKVSGDEIKFAVEAGERSFEMTAKRI